MFRDGLYSAIGVTLYLLPLFGCEGHLDGVPARATDGDASHALPDAQLLDARTNPDVLTKDCGTARDSGGSSDAQPLPVDAQLPDPDGQTLPDDAQIPPTDGPLIDGGKPDSSGLVEDAFFVAPAPTGQDSNPGTEAAPFATLMKARDAMRASSRKTTYLRAGTYVLNRTLRLGSEDSGQAWLAYPNEVPRVVGGRQVTDWRNDGGGVWSAPAPDTTASEFYDRNVRQVLSRYPNYDADDPRRGGWLFADVPSPSTLEKHIRYRAGDGVTPSMVQSGTRVSLVCHFGYFNPHSRVQSVNTETRVISVATNCTSIKAGYRYYFEGLPTVDADGEWTVDQSSGRILYRPGYDGFDGAKTFLPTLVTLLEIRGESASNRARDIRLRGIEFAYAKFQDATIKNAAIEVNLADQIAIEACHVENVQGSAIEFQATTNSVARGNVIEEVGHTGLITQDGARDNLLEGNYITTVGRWFRHAPGIEVSANANTARYNFIEEVPRSGIITGDIGNIVEYNEVRDYMLESADGAAIYAYGAGAGRPSNDHIWRYNFIHEFDGLNTTEEGVLYTAENVWGLYADGATKRFTIHGNIVLSSARGGVMIHRSGPHTVTNNIFLHGEERQGTIHASEAGTVFERNIIYYENGAAKVIDGTSAWIGNAEYNNNVYFSPTDPPNNFFNSTWAQWQGVGRDSGSTRDDPLFIDLAGGDYHIREESPARARGFEDLPFAQMGLKGYSGPAFPR